MYTGTTTSPYMEPMKWSHCEHCWHYHNGPIWMVLQPGQTLMCCCKCGTTSTRCDPHTRCPDWTYPTTVWEDNSPRWEVTC